METSVTRGLRSASFALLAYGVAWACWKVMVLDGVAVTLAAISEGIALALTVFFFTGSLFRRPNPDKVRGARIFGIAVASATIAMFLSAAIGIATH